MPLRWKEYRATRLAGALALLISACAAPRQRMMVPSPERIDLAAVHALIVRVVPGRGDDFELAVIPDSAGHDVFEVAGDRGKVVLRGSSGVAIASALNWYLEHVTKADVELPLVPVQLPSPLPAVDRPVHIATPYRLRYIFNYCTFSYSMAWWDWSDWQRMIDWMALKGINAPLAITGEEGTWRAVLRDMGFSRAQIGDFLVGPAYFPWGWMANVDGLGGPLPDSWIESHIALEQQILARERSLGMTPILQGFTGHVPESIKQVIPNAKIHQTGDWSAGFHGTWFLDPFDSLFQRMGADFMKRQQELFGTDHYYAADPFNEINPPSNDSTFLAAMGRAIYRGMASTDSQATWVLQAWFLVNSPKFWLDPQASALLGAVPDDRMLVLDLWGERSPVWKKRHAFYGKPWIWNVLYNFGGKVSVNGDLPHIAGNLDSVLVSPEGGKGKFSGIGMMIEGFGANPIVEEYVFDQVWRAGVADPVSWTRDYITRRYSGFDPSAWSAWQILLRTAFRSPDQTGNFLAERPQFYAKGRAYRTGPIPPYDPALLRPALDSLLAAAPRLGDNDNYRYDVVNLARQVLGEMGKPLVDSVQVAYERKDRPAMIAAEGRVEDLL
ncbi:MAG: alpha-N-acetylglucosaminidase TIM-barrel domain-containing protein, partial [Gemmatimonadales bacterium]